MNNINELFFSLIRVAIGTQDTLPHAPSKEEWMELYAMAKKQSLVGIAFAAIQRIANDNHDDDDNNHSASGKASEDLEPCEVLAKYWNMPEMLYLKWMGMAAKIQQRNEIVNKQCIALQKKLADDGLRSCILKGQGVASLYGDYLSGLRQSGDIDVWVDASKEKIVNWAKMVGMTEEPGYLHVGVRCFDGTEVELHYRPTYMRSLRHNKRLQDFCEEHKSDWTERHGMIVPSWEFDVVYQLSHIYRHLFGLGVGLRQLMDYYWTLSNSPVKGENFDLQKTLKYLGFYDFAGAVMYVMYEVFHIDEHYMICPIDEKRGKMLLRQVMQTGNFGKMDTEQKEARSTTMGSVKYKMSQWLELVRFYPEETLSAPLWSFIRHFD